MLGHILVVSIIDEIICETTARKSKKVRIVEKGSSDKIDPCHYSFFYEMLCIQDYIYIVGFLIFYLVLLR